jgi:2-C-methyl-D-erythritol 2,4-cyclodiphosphate synthase
MRVGIGYDVHAFAEGRTLVLGGHTFEGERGLAGHSDADVLLHAIIDALLGAAGLGDIGTHFPPGDPQWKDASSVTMLEEAAGMLVVRQLSVEYVDSTLIAERPKIGTKIPDMRRQIARAIGVDVSRVSVKATTTDGLGAIGRKEGIAAMAVCALAEV